MFYIGGGIVGIVDYPGGSGMKTYGGKGGPFA